MILVDTTVVIAVIMDEPVLTLDRGLAEAAVHAGAQVMEVTR